MFLQWNWDAARDMQTHLETLRAQIVECEQLQQAAKGQIKRDIFKRLVAHYRVLASELERAIAQFKEEKD